MGDWARVIEAVSTIRSFLIIGDGILGYDFVTDGRMGNDLVI